MHSLTDSNPLNIGTATLSSDGKTLSVVLITLDMSRTWRIVVGSDGAGYDYKETLKADLEKDPRVSEVIDVGVEAEDVTAYPSIAIAAAEKVRDNEADRALLVCGTGPSDLSVVLDFSPGALAAC